MLSIIEQLTRSQQPAANLKPSRKPHGPNVAKHSMSATQIEAEILKVLADSHGLLAEEILEPIDYLGLTINSINDALWAMCRKGAVVSARRYGREKMRYWLVADREEAVAWSRTVAPGTVEASICGLLADGELRSTPEIAEALGEWSAVVRKALNRLSVRGHVRSMGVRRGRGRSLTAVWVLGGGVVR